MTEATEADRLKQEGNAAFAAQRYDDAAALYTQAIELGAGSARERAILLSNICAVSLARANGGALADADAAARDAREAVELDGTFVRAWTRLAKVELARGAAADARVAIVHGLARCAADEGAEAEHGEELRRLLARSVERAAGGAPRAAGARGKKKIALRGGRGLRLVNRKPNACECEEGSCECPPPPEAAALPPTAAEDPVEATSEDVSTAQRVEDKTAASEARASAQLTAADVTRAVTASGQDSAEAADSPPPPPQPIHPPGCA